MEGVSALVKEVRTQGSIMGVTMDLEKEKIGVQEKEKSEIGGEKKRELKFSRVVISLETKGILEWLMDTVNHGFAGGEVGISDVADWLITKSKKGFSREELKEIRAAHTDERKILETILAGSAKAEDLPESLRKVIREINGICAKRAPKEILSRDDSPH